MQIEVITANEAQLIDAINAGYKEAIELANAVKEGQQSAIQKAAQVGVLLSQAKDRLKHGEWMPWLEKNCPDISWDTANRWIKISTVRNLESYQTQRAALQSLGLLPWQEQASAEPTDRANPNYVSYINKLLAVFAKGNIPIEQWTQEQKAKVAADLMPIVSLYHELTKQDEQVFTE